MKKSKILLLITCCALLVATTVLSTLAYLTSKDTVVNTFTVGQVDITLDEAAVTPDGTPIDGAERVKENKYHIVPGVTYTKDPTVTVKKNSEESYVRMLVTINCAKEFDAIYAPDVADLTTIFNGYDSAAWEYVDRTRDSEKNTITYEFRYKDTVKNAAEDTALEPLFTSITIPTEFTCNDMKSISDLKITVVGHAIQATTFADADEAWIAFNDQIND